MPHFLWKNVLLFTCFLLITSINSQDYDDSDNAPANPEQDKCIGVFLTYTFTKRTKEYPHVKNASAQAYAFDAVATILNTMSEDLKAWEFFVGFQHDEILVSVRNAVLTNGTDFPVKVGNGTTFSGFPDSDLLNAIETAGDMEQIQRIIKIKGTQFGVKPPGTPMPKTMKLMNSGFKCPEPTKKGGQMYLCCVKDPKMKKKTNTTKFLKRQKADLTIAYDILQAYGNNYLAQVTMDNWHPLGRLDNWNLTWEWKRGEFIYSMRGAYTLKRDSSSCIYSQAASYYTDFDFAPVISCDKNPIIVDLPPEREKDKDIGNLPFCCKNGTLLPKQMNSSLSTAMFQLQVYKMPPDLNRTTLHAPQNWKIKGELNPNYVCGPPVRVEPMEFPDPSGLMSETAAVASWQVGCNITRPKPRQNRCCVSFSAYYNESVIPCNTCACGCSDAVACDPDAQALLLPSEALLIPFRNRTAKAKAWAKLKHRSIPNPLPCGDNCGVSINWHIVSNYRNGWSARITLFNWKQYIFKDWFTAVTLDHDVFIDYQKVYSFNGTILNSTKHTVFMQGLEGLKYLVGIVNATDPTKNPQIPGKQQTVISFTKKKRPNIKLSKGPGFPTKVYFNGEECALPDQLPISNGYSLRSGISRVALAVISAFLIYLGILL
ncbi:Protein COBRA [Rhynchospora pubera]|uniref:Protein COBRA n=1 Tax=Rhynchospora pubera TaxID=906938 RepID=A0AAV8HDC4_9POAL|nr:Protein COBRA [Rhynchospora pubera]